MQGKGNIYQKCWVIGKFKNLQQVLKSKPFESNLQKGNGCHIIRNLGALVRLIVNEYMSERNRKTGSSHTKSLFPNKSKSKRLKNALNLLPMRPRSPLNVTKKIHRESKLSR